MFVHQQQQNKSDWKRPLRHYCPSRTSPSSSVDMLPCTVVVVVYNTAHTIA